MWITFFPFFFLYRGDWVLVTVNFELKFRKRGFFFSFPFFYREKEIGTRYVSVIDFLYKIDWWLVNSVFTRLFCVYILILVTK